MPVTFQQLKETARKGGAASGDDPFWVSRYFYRHITIYFTYAAVLLRLSANQVTLLSGLAMFAAAVCYGLPFPSLWLIGAMLVQLYFILDHVDGELARYERTVLGRSSGMAGYFYDTACHPGELAMLVTLALRLYVEFDGPWWILLIIVLMLFPGGIGPWQRYCETLVVFAQRHIRDGEGYIPFDALQKQSLSTGPGEEGEADHLSPLRKLAAYILQTIGFPGYFVTLLICTILDVASVPQLPIAGVAIPYLLIWLIVRAVYNAAAAVKSIAVYGRQLRSLND